MTGSFDVSTVEETWEVAAKLAATLKPGDVICLEGDLGAGKTTFTQGLAAALGVPGRVTSPTFCIVQEHLAEGSVPSGGGSVPSQKGTVPMPSGGSVPRRVPLLVHMDLYRLAGEEEVEAIGWEDYLSRGAVIAVEWPERAGSLIPNDAIKVKIEYSGEESRKITISTAEKCQESQG